MKKVFKIQFFLLILAALVLPQAAFAAEDETLLGEKSTRTPGKVTNLVPVLSKPSFKNANQTVDVVVDGADIKVYEYSDYWYSTAKEGDFGGGYIYKSHLTNLRAIPHEHAYVAEAQAHFMAWDNPGLVGGIVKTYKPGHEFIYYDEGNGNISLYYPGQYPEHYYSRAFSWITKR